MLSPFSIPSPDPAEAAHALGALSFSPHPPGAEQLLSMALSPSMELLQLPAGAVPVPSARALGGERREARPAGAPRAGTGAAFSAGVTGDAGGPAGVCILMTRGFCSNCGPFVPHKAAPGRRDRPGGASTAHLMHSGLQQC